ncbi:MAG: RNA polymerase sigma factor [Planctomycetota bacterium]
MADIEFSELVEEHYDRLFRAARFMCGDSQQAEDLVQDTFLAAADALERFEGRSSPYTWLYGILLNKFRQWIRRKNKPVYSLHKMAEAQDNRPTAELVEAETPGPVSRVENEETAEIVRAAVDELPPDHRAVVTLRFIEDLSYQEIAEALEVPLGTVKSRIHYALKKIGRKLSEADVG